MPRTQWKTMSSNQLIINRMNAQARQEVTVYMTNSPVTNDDEEESVRNRHI